MGLAISFMMLFFGLTSCAAAQMSKPEFYRGQVRDSETGIPLEKVLVVILWYRDVYSPATKRIHNEFHAAIEVLTDGHGRFEISRSPEIAQEPAVVHIQSPAIIFFKPWYRLYRIEVDGVGRFIAPTRIYMQYVKNPQGALDLGLAPDFPYHHTPLLLKALNEERARLGLALIQSSQKEKDQ